MKKIFFIFALVLIFSANAFAVMKHSAETQAEYLKYYDLVKKYPNNKRYLFEYSMVLAYMGRIESAGEQLRKVNELDDTYALKILKVLKSERMRDPKPWQSSFKLGFVYYFLYEEANGRIELARRRIKKATERPNDFSPGTKDTEAWIITEKTPIAEKYKEASLAYLYKVASKKPENNINAWGFAYMAVVKGIEKDWREAEALCRKALEIEPDAYAIRAAYMETLKQNGNFMGAAAQFNTAMSLKSEQEEYEKQIFGAKYQ